MKVASTIRRSSYERGLSLPPAPHQSSAEESVRFRVVRLLVLIVIAVQNCSLMMVTGYSRSLPGPRYLASTAVVAGELVKTVVIFSTLVYQHGICGVQDVILKDVLSRRSQTGRFAVPAFFYTVQNNLWYYAMSNLDPVSAAVTSQLKVLSTAVFSVLILQKQLTKRKWLALGVLVLGLVVMQLPASGADSQAAGSKARVLAGGGSGADDSNYALGLLCMVAACTSSGYAGVYLERLFKELNVSIWISNMQLQVFCMPIAMVTVLSDLQYVQQGNVLDGWDGLTCVVVLLNALGGFAVSLTMKYADNILKTFAVSVSLVMNCLLSSLFMSVQISEQAMAGVALVILGTWLYNAGASSGGGGAATAATREGSGKEYAAVKADASEATDGDAPPQEVASGTGDVELACARQGGITPVGTGGSAKPSPDGRTPAHAAAARPLPHALTETGFPEAVPYGKLTAGEGNDDEELRQLLSEPHLVVSPSHGKVASPPKASQQDAGSMLLVVHSAPTPSGGATKTLTHER